MKAVCQKCKKKHEGHLGVVKPLCLDCYGKFKKLTTDWEVKSSYCRTGRPKGSTQYEAAKINDTHRMTEQGHAFISKNKRLIERMAREDFAVQFKLV